MKLSISEIAGILGVATPEKEVEIRELLTDSRSLGDPGRSEERRVGKECGS